ncbi:MAG: phosphatidate cytidylyltransferase [Thiobacillaceae bacterium]|nr:phosphatidate cytidylyltransferase [Thiobacillaceae bacterium]
MATGLALGAALLVALFFAPAPLWVGLMAGVAIAGAWEWGGLMRLSAARRRAYAAATALLVGLLVAYETQRTVWAYLPSVLFWSVFAPLWLAHAWHLRQPLAGALVGWLLLLPATLAMIQLRALGPELLLAVVGMVVVADTAAYFTGRSLGRHKLAPLVSPGKTWEGFLGAAAAVGLYALLLSLTWPQRFAPPTQFLAAAWLLFLLSVLGDLFESWMKREASVKDSGRLLPGHGGVLDRIDSHLAVLPAATLYWMWLH